MEQDGFSLLNNSSLLQLPLLGGGLYVCLRLKHTKLKTVDTVG